MFHNVSYPFHSFPTSTCFSQSDEQTNVEQLMFANSISTTRWNTRTWSLTYLILPLQIPDRYFLGLDLFSQRLEQPLHGTTRQLHVTDLGHPQRVHGTHRYFGWSFAFQAKWFRSIASQKQQNMSPTPALRPDVFSHKHAYIRLSC